MGDGITLEKVNVEIESNSSKASNGIDQLTESIKKLKAATNGGINQLSGLNNTIKNITNNINSGFNNIGNINTDKIKKNISTKIKNIQQSSSNSAKNKFNIQPELDLDNLEDDNDALKEYGEKTKIISRNGEIVSVTLKKVNDGIETVTTASKKGITQTEKYVEKQSKLNNVLKAFSGIGILGIVKRVWTGIGKYTDMSSQYISNMNYFNTTMGIMKDTAKDFVNTMERDFYLDPSNVMNYMASFNSLIKGFGIADEQAYKMSKNLTQLSYDLAAFKGLSIEDAMQKIKSGISGELEPMRAIGVALDQATLQETAYKLGIEKRVSTMTRAQKTELLYYQMMQSTSQAQNYFANTLAKTSSQLDGSTKLILNPATALSILKQQFSQLGRAIGNIFIPILTKMIPYIMAATQVLMDLANAIAAAFGFELSDYDFTSTAGSISSGIDGIGDSADKTAKKVKGMLAPFDELNTIDFGNNGGGDTGISGGGSLGLPEQNYDWLKNDALTKRVEEIKEKFKDILPIVKSIGAALLTWKIGSKVIDFFDKLEIFTDKPQKLRALFGLTLIIASIGIAASAIEDLKNGNIKGGLLKSLASGLGVGIAASIMGLSLSVSALLGITIASIVFIYGTQQLGRNTWQGVLIENSNIPKQLKFNLQLAVGISEIVWSGLEKIIPEKQLKQLMEKMILNIASFLENIPIIGESIANAIRAGVAASKTEIGETIKYTSEEALKQANPWVKTKSEQLGRNSITSYNSAFFEEQPITRENIKQTIEKSIVDNTTNLNETAKILGRNNITSYKSGFTGEEGNTKESIRKTINNGLTNNETKLSETANKLGNRLNTKVGDGFIGNQNTLNSDFKRTMDNAITSGKKDLDRSAKTFGKDLGDEAKTGFKNGFDLSGIKFKMPHLSWTTTQASGWIANTLSALGLPTSLPKLKVSWYADGGFPEVGELFIANEDGPEWISTMGGKSAVANQDQMTTGIRQAAYEGVSQALRENPQSHKTEVNIGNRKVYEGYGSYQTRQANKYGVSTVTV